jgi:hypothetical protein
MSNYCTLQFLLAELTAIMKACIYFISVSNKHVNIIWTIGLSSMEAASVLSALYGNYNHYNSLKTAATLSKHFALNTSVLLTQLS